MERQLNSLTLRHRDVPRAIGLRLVVLREILRREDAVGATEVMLANWNCIGVNVVEVCH